MADSIPGNTPLRDLIFGEELQRLLDHCESVFKVRAGFFSLDGEPLRMGNSRHSRYCEIIKNEVYGEEFCHTNDIQKQGECLLSHKPLCYGCEAGLQEAVYPVMIDDRVAGFMMMGQLRTSKKIPVKIYDDIKDPEILSRLEHAFYLIPYVKKQKFDAIFDLFVMIVEFAIAHEIVSLRGDWMWEKISRYLDSNLTKKITLHDLSKISGRSISTVSHTFKEKSGKTFKRILNERRLDLADSFLADRPELSIGDIARLSGFPDNLYFSRVYRKYRGYPPSEKFR